MIDFTYLGFVYNFNVGWFFLEVGGAGFIKTPELFYGPSGYGPSGLALLQIGYMHRVIPPK